uniref:Uncharacterized protein n=1 Tax=Wuchereria bancrofti TaxID=6293 RepID=A0A1I8EWL3_WUCBA
MYGNIRPKGGAGRGKDMSNIISTENKRISTNVEDSYHSDGLEGHVRMKSKIGKPGKSRHRLSDLNVDEMTESDTDEYQGSETSKRNYSNKRTQSDDDFVVSGSKNETSSDRDSTSELSDNYRSEESSSSVGRRVKQRATTKWAPRASSSDAEDSNHSVQKTAAGRPLRKAVAKRTSLTVANGNGEKTEDDEEVEEKLKDVRLVGLGRKIESSDEFEPDDEEEEEDEEETVGDEETEDKEETSTVGDEKQSQSNEEESIDVTRDVTFSSTKTLSADGDEKQAEDVDDACPSTSNDVRIKIFYDESTKTEDVKKVEVKVAEKTIVTNMAAATNLSSLNPSSVMQQMARLASSSAAPVQQFDPSSIAYRDILQTTASTFIANGTPLHIYSGPAPVTVYQVQQPPFVRTPAGVVPSNIGHCHRHGLPIHLQIFSPQMQRHQWSLPRQLRHQRQILTHLETSKLLALSKMN